jgi:hypothetical protein
VARFFMKRVIVLENLIRICFLLKISPLRLLMGEERLQRTCDQVREAMRRLHEQGCYPSNRQLHKVLAKPAILREPAVRAVWRETLRELGWDQ